MAGTEFDPTIYPIVYGNELETSITVERRRLVFNKDFPGDELLAREEVAYEEPKNVRAFIPTDLYTKAWEEGNFLGNGFKVYDGLVRRNIPGAKRVEIATPEGESISEVVALTRTAEVIIERGAQRVLENAQRRRGGSSLSSVRIQKRVVDKIGNTWGCHDNYGFDPDTFRKLAVEFPLYIGKFNANRAFITGAGYFSHSGYRFSQKLDFTSADNVYAFSARHFRNASGVNEDIKRLEIGSGDPNISDWATAVRVGSIALLLAILATSHSKPVDKYFDDPFYKQDVQAYGRGINGVDYNPDTGSIYLNGRQQRSIDMIRTIAETFLEEVVPVVGAPRDLRTVAGELIKFCDDFAAVGAARSTVDILADRADWAGRLLYIEKRAASDTGSKDPAMRRQIADLNYDATVVKSQSDGAVTIHRGRGFVLRERGKLKASIPQKTVDYYYDTPPRTRAAARAALLRSGHAITSADWHSVSLFDRDKDKIVTISLPTANNPELPDFAKKYLQAS